MTKRFHVCDDRCEPAGTGIHNNKTVDIRSKVAPKKTKAVKRTPTPSRVKKESKEAYVETEFGKVRVHISSVYDPNYKLIDETIEEIKKTSRTVSVNEYSTNNVFLILQDALKKVRLAEK
jgi:hypothetical protein